MHVALVPHPDTPSSAVSRIEAEVGYEGGRLRLRYWIEGDTAKVRWPARAEPERTDGLWRHTCFEAFVQTADGYHEFNMTMYGQWASYHFNSYRAGMTPAEEQVLFDIHEGRDIYMDLGFLVDLPRNPERLGLSAVIEDIDGAISYWALAHPSDKPDFHHPDSFVLDLP
ncbi:MAG: DOMON-like domain-containing protein [Brevundimonas sp.]|nr:DOMON-like domain-containing protein [Brevundimonas sp.]